MASVSTLTCWPRMASCSCAAGRRVSSEAISTLRFSRSVRRLAILAVVVVLPEPCRPTIRIGTGGAARRLRPAPSDPPSVSTSASWTIFTTIWPGLIDLTISAPTALALTFSVKVLTTSRATSASSRARRTSRSASSTSDSDSAPRPVILSNMPDRRSLRVSNMVPILWPKRISHPGAKLAAGCWPPHLPGMSEPHVWRSLKTFKRRVMAGT